MKNRLYRYDKKIGLGLDMDTNIVNKKVLHYGNAFMY